MYNIPVTSTSNILVLICTAIPFFPLLAYTSFNIYNIPFFSTINILVIKRVYFSIIIPVKRLESCTDKSREGENGFAVQ